MTAVEPTNTSEEAAKPADTQISLVYEALP